MRRTTADNTKPKKKTSSSKKPKRKKEVSFYKKPEDIALDAWQFALRKQFGETNPFTINNQGTHPIFSDFTAFNPATKNEYRVAIRSSEVRFGKIPQPTLTQGNNFCSCQDFKTNRLGICKHISAVISVILKKRGHRKLMKEGFTQPHSAIYLDYQNGKHIRICIGSENRAEFLAWYKQYFDESGLILEKAYPKFVEIIKEARDIQPDFRCYPDAFDYILHQRDQFWRQAQLAKVMPKGPDSPYFDDLLKANLFPYQKSGIYFAAHSGRCLIADEMGLGKTIQAIGAAEVFKREFNIQKVLIVCPTSLKYQWKTEIHKFNESATSEIIEGPHLSRKKKYAVSEAFFQIASYHTVMFDIEQITKMDYDLIILDEAQRIKNFRSRIAGELKKIYTPYAIVLTGTPLENKLEELYSIVQFIDQHKLPPLYRFLDRYQITNETGKVTGFKNLKEIASILENCLLRRQKKDVLKQLPKRMDKILYVPMTKQQQEIHTELADGVARLVSKWIKQHFLSESDRRKLLLMLGQMRMVCDSTFILDQSTRHDTKITELMCILEEALTNPEQKVVVFSQWERMTRIVAQECAERGIGYVSLHGSVPGKDRGALIETFNNDPDCRLFISTDAGGVGLNLQTASLLINLDIPWNPAILEQRIGRIYRLGQENNITVINMVALHTIEHRMLGVLEFKSDMAKGVLDPEGEDMIFMTENKFRKFMQTVESLTEQAEGETTSDNTDEEEIIPNETLESIGESINETKEQIVPKVVSETPYQGPNNPPQAANNLRKEPSDATFEGDDDVPNISSIKTPEGTNSNQNLPVKSVNEPLSVPDAASLVQSGVSFLSGLVETLKSPEKTQALVGSLVEKDKETGQTYLKIPVESQEIVENAMKMFGSLFANFGK
jgi:superfamily II DNA or RNA helicase